MGSHIRISLFVEFIGIGGKDSMHTVSIVFPPFQTQVDAEVAPGSHLGCRIVTHIDIESIDKTYLFKSGGVLIALDLHLKVVAQREGNASLLTLARHSKERVLIRRVADERYISIGISLLISIPVSIARSTKIWRIAEAYSWREHVAYGLYLVTEELAVGHPETIKFGRGTDAHVPVVHIMETIGRISHLDLLLLVPRLSDLISVHTVRKVEVRTDVDVLEEREVGTYRNAMFPSVAPVFNKIALEKQVFLRGDGVAHMSCIAQCYLLIPSLVTHHLLATEWIETRNVDIEVGQSDCQRRVAHVLREVGSCRQRHTYARKVGAPVDRRGSGTLRHRLWIIERVEIVALITG